MPRVANKRNPIAIVLLALIGIPVIAGTLSTALPAFGYLPAIGGHSFSLEPWRALFASPWFFDSIRLSLVSGIAATLLSLLIALCAVLALQSAREFSRVERWLNPILATPHVALAIGYAFLIAPSGWIARLISPWLTGWETPPDIASVGDPYGISLIAGMVLKEAPYLALMTLAALNQIPARSQLAVARSLGYSHAHAWLVIVLPQVLPQLRLPVLAVLAYSLANVDVAIMLGPNNPPTLAVQTLRAFTDYDLKNYFPASAAAMLLFVLVTMCAAAYILFERVSVHGLKQYAQSGVRSKTWVYARTLGTFLGITLPLLALFSLAMIVIWAFTNQWRFPSVSPNEWGINKWSQLGNQLGAPLFNSLLIATISTLTAAGLTIVMLEFETNRDRMRAWLYAPLIVPQIAFLFGAQVMAVRFGIDGHWLTVVWFHLVFVLPYFYLSLVDPWHALDPRYARSARALGANRWRVLVRIKLPLLLRPILIACAVGFAVSIGQYLATVFASGGRVATVTTEAITLSSGGDRRTLAVYALLQATLPFAVYALAAFVPKIRFRHRRSMQLATQH
jgi:putative thiamine transport system permease protein